MNTSLRFHTLINTKRILTCREVRLGTSIDCVIAQCPRGTPAARAARRRARHHALSALSTSPTRPPRPTDLFHLALALSSGYFVLGKVNMPESLRCRCR